MTAPAVPVPEWITAALTSCEHEGLKGNQLVLRMIRELRGLDFSNDQIIATFDRTELFAGKSAEFVRKQLERMDDKATSKARGNYTSDADYAKMNLKYSVVKAGAKTRVHSFGPDGSSVYESFEGFCQYQNKDTKQYKNADGDTKSEGRGTWWLNQRAGRRSQYEAVRFMPWSDEPEVDGCLNLWRGFFVAPEAGDGHQSFLDHVRETICSGNAEHYSYLIGWMASRIQHRGKPAGVAVVLKSETEGTGKSFFAKHFGALFGRHFKHISNADHLVGKFNAHLQDCALLFSDEAFYAGDRKHEGILKAIITEDQIMVELKGIDATMAPNYMAAIMASNLKFVVPAGHSARRYFVLEVSTRRLQDFNYFDGIARDLAAGGYASLLHFLQNYDLTDFNIRNFPHTAALAEQKAMSLSPAEQWWSIVLEEGVLPGAWSRFPNRAYSRALFDDAKLRSPKLKLTGDNELAAFIRSKGAQRRPSNNAKGWQFPTLAECRKAWCDRFPGTMFPDPRAEWGGAERNDQGGQDDIPF